MRSVARLHGTRALVETGTYMGEMLEAVARDFDRIYSIELDAKLCQRAKQRLRAFPHIAILEGASEEVLPAVLERLGEKATFWLDAHYSGGCTARGRSETPAMCELAAIIAHPIAGHVVLFDDARCFDGTNDYPTIENLADVARSKWPDCSIETIDDVICICNKAERAESRNG